MPPYSWTLKINHYQAYTNTNIHSFDTLHTGSWHHQWQHFPTISANMVCALITPSGFVKTIELSKLLFVSLIIQLSNNPCSQCRMARWECNFWNWRNRLYWRYYYNQAILNGSESLSLYKWLYVTIDVSPSLKSDKSGKTHLRQLLLFKVTVGL